MNSHDAIELVERQPTIHDFKLTDPNQEFSDAASAVDALLDLYILSPLLSDNDHKSIFFATYALLKENNRFSFIMAAIFFGAFPIGILASLFSLEPSVQSIIILGQIAKHFHKKLPQQARLTVMTKILTTTRNAILNAYSGSKLLHTYLGKTSTAQQFLIKHAATRLEIIYYYLSKGGTLTSAGVANIPVFLASLALGIPLDIFITSAAISVNWLGFNNIKFFDRQLYPAHRIELAYLAQQIQLFSHFSSEQKFTFLDIIKRETKNNATNADIHKEIYLLLLKLSSLGNDAEILLLPSPNKRHLVFAISCGILGTCAQLTFAESTVRYILGLRALKGPLSPGAIILAFIAFMFALGPALGIGKGSYLAGKKILSDDVPIGNDYYFYLRKLFECLMVLLNLVAIGTIVDFSYNCAADLTNLTKIKTPQSLYIEIVFMFLCYLGSALTLSFYLVSLVQNIFTHYAQHNGNEEQRRIVQFELGLHSIHQTIASMSDQNYMDWLVNRLTINEHSSRADIALADFLNNLFETHLKPDENAQLKYDLKIAKENTAINPSSNLKKLEMLPAYSKVGFFAGTAKPAATVPSLIREPNLASVAKPAASEPSRAPSIS